ncbi:MAG: TlpA disulfide reductase family protein [Saprospiraceae bacterium]
MKVIFTILNLILASVSFTIQGCKAQPQAQIAGQITLHPAWKAEVYLIHPRNFSEIAANFLGQVIDSADIDADGNFAFQNLPAIQEKLLLQLVVQKSSNRYPNQLADTIPSEANYMPFILSKGNPVIIKADISAFQKSFVFSNTTNENSVLISLRDIRLNAFQKYLAEDVKEIQADSMLIEKENLYRTYINALMWFADTTTNIEAAMVAIRWISLNGDFERVPEFIKGQCQKWQRDRPENLFTVQLCHVADKNILPVMVGDLMPEFALPLITGDTVMLSKLLGQRLTIVDIWASWCAPCRKENRMVLTPLWSTYKDKGLQIIGYSIDNNASSWKSAVLKDGASWSHSSHLTGDATPFLEALRISTIPANFILDGGGKIIAKNLNGDALIEFVKSQLD